MGDRLDTTPQQFPDLRSDVQALSHELHPPILDRSRLGDGGEGFTCGTLSFLTTYLFNPKLPD